MIRKWLAVLAVVGLIGLFPGVGLGQQEPLEDNSEIQTGARFFFSDAFAPFLLMSNTEIPQGIGSGGLVEAFAFLLDIQPAGTEQSLLLALVRACADESIDAAGVPVVVVCADDIDVEAILAAQPAFAAAEVGAPFPEELPPRFQFTFLWSDPAKVPYDGPAGQPNTGNTDSFDLFQSGNGLANGRTSYEQPDFIFNIINTSIGFVGPDWVGTIFPGEEVMTDSDTNAWVFTDDWVSAPAPWGQDGPPIVQLGDESYVADTEAESTEVVEEDPPPEEDPESEPETVVEEDPDPEPEVLAEENPEPEPISATPDESSGPNIAVVAGAAAAAAAVAGGAFVAAKRRRKGPCDEKLDAYDRAQREYEAVVAARGRAIDAEGIAMQAQRDATTEAEQSAAASALAAAQEAIREAEAADQPAWDNRLGAWNAYLDCTEEHRVDTTRQPPPTSQASSAAASTSSSLTGEAAAVAGGAVVVDEDPVVSHVDEESATHTSAPLPTPSDKDSRIEWKKEWLDGVVVPTGEVHIKINYSTRAFFLWMQEHGDSELEDDDEYEENMPIEGSFSVGQLEIFKGRQAQPLFERPQRKFDVDVVISIYTKTEVWACQREYIVDDSGDWVWTRKSKFAVDYESDGDPKTISRPGLPNGIQVARVFDEAITAVENMNRTAQEKLNELDNKCAGN